MRKLITACCLPLLLLDGACTLVLGHRPADPASTHVIPPFTIPPAGAGVAYERFIVLGDMGTGRPGQQAVADAMAQRAASDELDFIITVGDNIYPAGVESVDDPQWKNKFEDVYADPALLVPIYAALGNHDYYGNAQDQIDYALQNPNWKMTGPYYTFVRTLADGTAVQFFAIDTDPIVWQKAPHPPDITEQLSWLGEALAASDARWKIVFGHHPLYGHTPKRGHNEMMISTIEPVLVEHGVDVYFAGHDHVLEMIKPVKGVHHVTSGAGGGPEWAYEVEWTDEAYYAATGGGFALCRVSRDTLVIEFVRLDARTQYAHVLKK